MLGDFNTFLSITDRQLDRKSLSIDKNTTSSTGFNRDLQNTPLITAEYTFFKVPMKHMIDYYPEA